MAVAGPGSSETVLSGKVSGLLTLHMFLARRQEGCLQRKPRMCCDVSVSLGDQQMEAFHGHFQCIRSWEEVWGRLRNRSAEKASPRRRKAVDEAQQWQHAEMVRTDCAQRR